MLSPTFGAKATEPNKRSSMALWPLIGGAGCGVLLKERPEYGFWEPPKLKKGLKPLKIGQTILQEEEDKKTILRLMRQEPVIKNIVSGHGERSQLKVRYLDEEFFSLYGNGKTILPAEAQQMIDDSKEIGCRRHFLLELSAELSVSDLKNISNQPEYKLVTSMADPVIEKQLMFSFDLRMIKKINSEYPLTSFF